MPRPVPLGGRQAPSSAEGSDEWTGGRPPPLCSLHRLPIPPPAVSLPGPGWGAGKGLKREVANHWRREALPGKEGDVGKRRYQQRRELGRPGKERERAEREKGARRGGRGYGKKREGRGQRTGAGSGVERERGVVGGGGTRREGGFWEKERGVVKREKGRGVTSGSGGAERRRFKGNSSAKAARTCRSVCLCCTRDRLLSLRFTRSSGSWPPARFLFSKSTCSTSTVTPTMFPLVVDSGL